eukprot:m.109176 g.109176  ORF g.109176 m.109176 type:complete len:419 (+) comp13367_c0_seq1:210-1466(+)
MDDIDLLGDDDFLSFEDEDEAPAQIVNYYLREEGGLEYKSGLIRDFLMTYPKQADAVAPWLEQQLEEANHDLSRIGPLWDVVSTLYEQFPDAQEGLESVFSSMYQRVTAIRKQMTPEQKKNLAPALTKYLLRAKGVLLVFVLDVTRTMEPTRDALRDKMHEILRVLQSKHKKAILRLGVVAFRDLDDMPDQELFEPRVVNNSTLREFNTFMQGLKVYGGGDEPEDIAGGLRRATEWFEDATEITRTLILITDAPAHGRRFHGDMVMMDSYPHDDETDDPLQYITQLAKNNVDVFMTEMMQRLYDDPNQREVRTDVMYKMFVETYEQAKHDQTGGRKTVIRTFKLNDDADEFIPSIVDSVGTSITLSEAQRAQVRMVEVDGVQVEEQTPQAVFAEAFNAAQGEMPTSLDDLSLDYDFGY